MPEGPEVQVITSSLKKFEGKKIVAVQRFVERPWVFQADPSSLIGRRLERIDRLGKFIIFNLDADYLMVSHLSFTGSYQMHKDDFSGFMLLFNNNSRLFYSDKRGLGKLRVMTRDELARDKTLSAHVLDGLRASPAEIYDRLYYLRNKGVKKELKPFLLDYHYICGIGNIYGSEIAFHAGLSPFKKFNTLSDDELTRLSTSISFILKRAYNAGGSSIESFTDLNSNPGHAQDYHAVYFKDICPECGERIMQIQQDKRSTFYCPNCQKGE